MTMTQIQRVVFHKGRLFIVGQNLEQPIHPGRLPVTFCPEAIAIPHQHLRSQTWQLLQAMQIFKVGGKGRVALVIHELLDGKIFTQLVANGFNVLFMVVVAFHHFILFFKLLIFSVNVFFINSINIFNQITNWPVVNGPA